MTSVVLDRHWLSVNLRLLQSPSVQERIGPNVDSNYTARVQWGNGESKGSQSYETPRCASRAPLFFLPLGGYNCRPFLLPLGDWRTARFSFSSFFSRTPRHATRRHSQRQQYWSAVTIGARTFGDFASASFSLGFGVGKLRSIGFCCGSFVDACEFMSFFFFFFGTMPKTDANTSSGVVLLEK